MPQAWRLAPRKSKLKPGYAGVLSKYADSVGTAHEGALVGGGRGAALQATVSAKRPRAVLEEERE